MKPDRPRAFQGRRFILRHVWGGYSGDHRGLDLSLELRFILRHVWGGYWDLLDVATEQKLASFRCEYKGRSLQGERPIWEWTTRDVPQGRASDQELVNAWVEEQERRGRGGGLATGNV